MNRTDGKKSVEKTEIIENNISELSESQLKLIEEAEAEYERGDFIKEREANRIVKIWLESMNYLQS